MNILIAGASGNLGSHIARHLSKGPHSLKLLVHKTPLPDDLVSGANPSKVEADLNDPGSLRGACRNIDCIVYAAGVLFKARPATFLHTTNTVYVQNIVDAAHAAGVRKFIMLSFPHVEGETTPDARARGSLEAQPRSIHSQTRLAAERYLFRACENKTMRPVVFRSGVIYGRGVKLIEAARKLMRWGSLPIWSNPTWVHLLSIDDFVRMIEIGVVRDDLTGIYNLADDRPMMLQDFLDELAVHWGFRKPRRLPAFSFYVAAAACEAFATMFRTGTPLTRNLISMGMTSVVADTSRMKNEIVSSLIFPTLKEGLATV